MGANTQRKIQGYLFGGGVGCLMRGTHYISAAELLVRFAWLQAYCLYMSAATGLCQCCLFGMGSTPHISNRFACVYAVLSVWHTHQLSAAGWPVWTRTRKDQRHDGPLVIEILSGGRKPARHIIAGPLHRAAYNSGPPAPHKSQAWLTLPAAQPDV